MKKLATIGLWLLIIAGISAGLYMEETNFFHKSAIASEGTKVSDKTALATAPALDDVLYIVDVSESGVTASKKIEIEYLRLSGVSNYASGTTTTLDFSTIDAPRVALSNNPTILVMGGLPTAGTGARVYYLTVVNASGTGTITWPSDVVWPGGTEVQPTLTANAVDVFPFLYGLQSGTTKYMLAPIKDLK